MGYSEVLVAVHYIVIMLAVFPMHYLFYKYRGTGIKRNDYIYVFLKFVEIIYVLHMVDFSDTFYDTFGKPFEVWIYNTLVIWVLPCVLSKLYFYWHHRKLA